MEQGAVSAASVAASAAYDFSVWSLFLRADIVVKVVMILLFAASVWCWAIIIEKVIRLRRLNEQARDFEDNFWSGGSLDGRVR